MERELYCVPCDAFFPTRAEHLRSIGKDNWGTIQFLEPNVEAKIDPPVEKGKKNGK